MARYSPPLAWWYLKKQRQRRASEPAPPEPFDPSDLFAAGEQGAWYDPSDLTTLFQDAAGTVPVTADGDPVGLMLDKSGNGNHAPQAATSSRPTYRTDGTLHWLEFDGADDFLVTSPIDLSTSDKISIVSGLRKLIDTSRGLVCELGPSGTPNAFIMTAPNEGSLGSFAFYSRGSGRPSGAQANGYFAPMSAVLTGLGSNPDSRQILRVDGAQAAIITADAGVGGFKNSEIYIGRRGGTSIPLNGNIYGLILRNALTEGADLTNAEAWLAAKTGVTL